MKKSIKNDNGNLLPSVLILSGPVHTLLFPCYCAITLFFVAKCSLNSHQAYRPRKMSTLKKNGRRMWPYLPNEETEEAEECVHETHIVRDAGHDRLLTVWTNCLHRWRLEHFPLQYGHGGGPPRRSQDGCCVAPHVNKVTGAGAHVSRHRVRIMTRRWWVNATFWG